MISHQKVVDAVNKLKVELSSLNSERESPSPYKNAFDILVSCIENLCEVSIQINEDKSDEGDLQQKLLANMNDKVSSFERQNEDLAKGIMILKKNYSLLTMMNDTMRNDVNRDMIAIQHEFDELNNKFQNLKENMFNDINKHINQNIIPQLSKNIKQEILNDMKTTYSFMIEPDKFEEMYQKVITLDEKSNMMVQEINETANIGKKCQYSINSVQQRLRDLSTQFQDDDNSIKANFNDRISTINKTLNEDVNKNIQSIYTKINAIEYNQRMIETEHSKLINTVIDNPLLKKYVVKICNDENATKKSDQASTIIAEPSQKIQEMEKMMRNSVIYCQELTEKMENLFSNTVNVDTFQQKLRGLEKQINNKDA